MTLSVYLYRPPPAPFEYVDVPEIIGQDAAGFESFRTVLWGSPTLANRGSKYFLQIRHGDFFVSPDEFADFRAECDWIYRNARDIACEIWPHGWIDTWCPIKRKTRIRAQRALGACSVRTYISRFRNALRFAEHQQLGFSIG